MNKIMAIAMGLILLGGSAVAQDNNPNSAAYHAIHNPQSPYYQGPQQQPAVQRPPQPTGYWEKTWGALAPSPNGGVLGTALGASSKQEAERLALADCKTKGGMGCQVELAYQNQCAAMVVGKERIFAVSAGNDEGARLEAIKFCSESDTGCRVYYSACTAPVFHRY